MKKVVICLVTVIMMACVSSNFVVSAAKPKNNITTTISRIESKGKGFKVVWKSKSKINGYQIQYSTSSKFKKAKVVTVSGKKSKSKTITNLKGCKVKYYVRIRTYKIQGGKKIYSSWSKKKSIYTLGHKYKKATCTNAKKCVYCGKTSGKALGHTVVKDKKIAATCTTNGLTAGSHCTKCNKVIVKQKRIKATGHKSGDWIIDKNATCTESGSKHAECKICGVTVKTETIPMTEHTIGIDNEVPATCTVDGLTAGSHCTKCNAVIVAQEKIKAFGHKELILESIAPTCTATGLTEGKKCTNCHAILKEQEVISMIEHSYDDGICTACGAEYCSEGLEVMCYGSYNGIERAAIITGYNGTDTEVYIPKIYNDSYIVVGIDAYAFEENVKITKVKIPETVTYIGAYAFNGCTNLKVINIPDRITNLNGSYMFMDCINLEAVVMPNSVMKIGQNIFNGCKKLKTVILSNQLTEIPMQAFLGCKSLESITIPDKVTKVGVNAFNGCANLEKVEILGNVDTIDMQAFCYCTNLKEIVLPSTVTTINSSAFCGCSSLEQIIIPKAVTTIGYYAFKECSNLRIYCETQDNIQEGWHEDWNHSDCPVYYNYNTDNGGVTEDGFQWKLNGNNIVTIIRYALKNASVIIPSEIEGYEVQSIGEFAFAYLTTLESIEISKGIKDIEDIAFIGCSSLKKVTVPNTIDSIGSGNFNDSLFMQEVYYEGTLQEWMALLEKIKEGNEPLTSVEIYLANGEKVNFADNGYLEYKLNEDEQTYAVIGIGLFNGSILEIPETYNGKAVTKIGEGAFMGCPNLEEVILGENVTIIETGAFYECKSLKEVTIPDSVESVGDYVFYWCSELTNVNISNNSSLTKIGKSMFHWCEKLIDVTIPDNVTEIGNWAFIGCKALTSVTIPSGVTYIGESSFNNSGLISITIPVNVKEIGNAAFCNCTELVEFKYNGTKTKWNNIVKGNQWSDYSGFDEVICSNGSVGL